MTGIGAVGGRLRVQNAARCARLWARYASTSTLATFRPRRGFLYMPGNSEKMVRKAATQLDPDTVVMDCEDAVALASKPDARTNIVKMLETLDFGRSERAVRVNSPCTELAEEDLKAVLTGPVVPDCVVLPKVDHPDHVAWIMDRARSLIPQGEQGLCPALIIMAESATGLLNLRASIEAAVEGPAPLRLEGVVFGGDDYAASVGAERQPKAGSPELLTARQLVVMHCRAYNLQSIDIVNIDLSDDPAHLTWEAQQGFAMGYTGKQIIHPKQIAPVQAAFTPDAGRVAAARDLVQAFDRHAQQGVGTFVYRGQMIDNPTVLQARNTLAQADVS